MTSVFYFKWENETEREHAIKEESIIKWVKWLLCCSLPSQPRTLFWLWLMLVMWCDHPIHRDGSIFILPTTPSDRRLRDFEIAMKQSRYDMMKDPSIETSFGSEICLLSLMFVCCAGDHLAPWQYHHQHRPGSGIPLLVRALSRWSRNDSDDGPAAGHRQHGAGWG